MSLEPGTRLGPYEIVARAGAGGMGEVYRARDTRLDRTVAVKVLPTHLSADPAVRARFEREARAVSSLNHPNICVLHDVGSHEGIDYLVLEHLEGETLAARLERGSLALPELLPVAAQVADALDKAHRQGLVHRDLKPGNIMLTRSGAKLLDFGLAKSVAGLVPSGLTAAPTATSPLTAAGTLVGTFHYMAPEQLEGQEADARADIFAFGTTLREMATGRRTFDGRTQASVIAGILERDPDPVSSERPGFPPALDHLIRTCLAKDPDERRQSMHDILLELRFIAAGGAEAAAAGVAPAVRRRLAGAAWAGAALLAVGAVALGWWLGRGPAEEAVSLVSDLAPGTDQAFHPAYGGQLAISRDGNMVVATVSTRQARAIWVRDLQSGESRLLEGTGGGFLPFWSPDGRSIGFFESNALRRIDLVGGAARTVCATNLARGGAWGPDGTILVAGDDGRVLIRCPATGGEAVNLFTAAQGSFVEAPRFLPDGRHFLFTEVDGESRAFRIMAAEVDGEPPRVVLTAAAHAHYARGYLLFAREGMILAQPFDLDAREVRGEPALVAQPVLRAGGGAGFTVSAGGRLVYLSPREGSNRGRIVIRDRSGTEIAFADSPASLDDLAISRDDRFLAMARDAPEGTQDDIWTYEIARGIFTRVTFDGRSDDPAISPDGAQIIFASGGDLHRKSASGAGEAESLLTSPEDEVTVDWSLDGRTVLFNRYGEQGSEDIWMLDLESGEARALLTTPFREIHPQISPDGRWLAYASSDSGDLQVYVLSWPGMERKWQVSRDGGSQPRWRRDGAELYFVAPDRRMMAVPLRAGTGELEIGTAVPLFVTRLERSYAIRTHQYAVTRDGEQFILIESSLGEEGGGRVQPLTLVSDFVPRALTGG